MASALDLLPEVFAPLEGAALRSPQAARGRLAELLSRKRERAKRSTQMAREFDALNARLAIADKVTETLEQLGNQMFQQVLKVLEDKLTIALQEILEQPLCLKAETGFSRKTASVEFKIERDGNTEDVLRGQGGSVANILSVGLRMFALTTLEESQHRRFLVLDEQDCWLRPDLVPRLVKIVHDAGQALGFQVILISHHDVAMFERYADKIYRFIPTGDNAVDVQEVLAPPRPHDPE